MGRNIPRKVAGSALTEFVLIVPMFIMVFYYTLFLNDITVNKIKSLDITRYVAFAMADTQGSNYHDKIATGILSTFGYGSSFDLAKDVVNENTKLIWGDLNPTNWSSSIIGLFASGTSDVRMSIDSIEKLNSPKLYDGGASYINDYAHSDLSLLQNVLSKIQNEYDKVLERAGFNTDGMAKVTVSVFVKNKMIPTSYRDRNGRTLLDNTGISTELKITHNLIMYTDSWKLEDGRNIHMSDADVYDNIETSGVFERLWAGVAGSPYHQQVARMWMGTYSPKNLSQDIVHQFSGSDSSGGEVLEAIVGKAVQWALGFIPARPFDVKVVSHAYKESLKDGMINAFRYADNAYSDHSVEEFHTAPMVEDPNDETGSEYYKTWNKRGPYFMGCKDHGVRHCKPQDTE